MRTDPDELAAARRAAAEFELGEIRDLVAVTQGTSPCFRLDAARGVFALKREPSVENVDLAAEVALGLDRRGFPQAVFQRTRGGSLLSSDGLTATAWLPGVARSRPRPEESAPLMRALSRYQELLADLEAPIELRECRTVWTRLGSLDHLLGDLYEECRRVPEAAAPVEAAARLLREKREVIAAVPRQLIHSDLGGGNILYAPDRIGFIDFSPQWDSHLAGLGGCLYWCDVSATGGMPDRARMAEEIAVYAAARDLSPLEREIIPAMVVKEAYKRVATVIHLGMHGDPGRAAAWERRLRCLVALTAETA
jgi:Ser/Thr protein kinase RdoA (MazF antagonist)